tara:strand:+ start:936 stop:1208 length:273 start_codon:yes stop_codon:yes gene_type:complete
MMTYLVIGLCLFLLIVVVYISAKPISMGIEARRNIKDVNDNNTENMNKEYDESENNKTSISDEILKLNDLKNKGILSAEEYKKAKDKLIN